MSPRVSAANRDDYMSAKRETVIEAAFRVFVRKGYDASSIEDIAREAGIGKGTVYLYFKSKDDLLLSILEERGFLPELEHLITQPDISLEEHLRLIADHYFDFMVSMLPSLKMLTIGFQHFPDITRDIYTKIVWRGTQDMEKVIKSHISDPNKPVNASILAAMFFSTLFSYVLTQDLLGGREVNPISRDAWVTEVVEMFKARLE